MRVCIVAEHASTRFGGEAILPVHYFRLLRSRGIEAWLVVHARTRDELKSLFATDLDRIRFVEDSWIQKVIFRIGTKLPRRLSEVSLGLLNQFITQFQQRKIVGQLIRMEKIDVIHQPIPVAPRFPSLLFGLGIPRVVGPLNGGMEYPPFFRRAESGISRAFVAAARTLSNLGNTLFPGKKHADVVLVANERTRKALPSGVSGKVIVLPENGVDLDVWNDANDDNGEPTPRFVFIGRLVDWKSVDVVIRALTDVPGAELEIIGEGPMTGTWKSLAAHLGLSDRVRFEGWLPQHECAAHLRSATALVLPSLYECGGAVVLEAMAMGKAVIATNWGGPADYVDATSGFLIQPESDVALIKGFATAMKMLIDSPELAKSMGAAGRESVIRNFDWQRKIDRMISIYGELAELSKSNHGFGQDHISPASVSEQQ